MAIAAQGLTRRFGGLTALYGLDLRVETGTAVALFGPNGAGKSTLLRLCATLLRPSAGEVRLFGQAVRDGGAAARRRVGFLSHHSFLYADLTPVQNLEFYARMFKVPFAERRVRQVLEQVDLVGWAQRPVRTLSRGLEQRCAIARVLLHEPDLLLLDEPFTGLDADAAAMLSQLLREAHARGATLLMTTHDLPRGVDLCNRALILVRGRLAWDGAITDTDAAAFETLYHSTVRAAGGHSESSTQN